MQMPDGKGGGETGTPRQRVREKIVGRGSGGSEEDQRKKREKCKGKEERSTPVRAMQRTGPTHTHTHTCTNSIHGICPAHARLDHRSTRRPFYASSSSIESSWLEVGEDERDTSFCALRADPGDVQLCLLPLARDPVAAATARIAARSSACTGREAPIKEKDSALALSTSLVIARSRCSNFAASPASALPSPPLHAWALLTPLLD